MSLEVRPVVILTMARSRSSMIAEIFREHGVFFGDVWRPGSNRLGYNEHKLIKKWARGRSQTNGLYPTLLKLPPWDKRLQLKPFDRREWLDRLEQDGWDGKGSWGVKVDAFCSDAFMPFKPHFIGLKRDIGDTIASNKKAWGDRFTKDEWRIIVEKHHYALDCLHCPIINTDEVVKGDYTSLAWALNACYIDMDANIAERVLAQPKNSSFG